MKNCLQKLIQESFLYEDEIVPASVYNLHENLFSSNNLTSTKETFSRLPMLSTFQRCSSSTSWWRKNLLIPPAIQYIALMCSEWCLLVNRSLNCSLQTHSATSFSNVSRRHVHGINLKPLLLPKTCDISIAFFWFDFASLQFTKKATKIKIGNLIG